MSPYRQPQKLRAPAPNPTHATRFEHESGEAWRLFALLLALAAVATAVAS